MVHDGLQQCSPASCVHFSASLVLHSAAGAYINPCRPCYCSGMMVLEDALPAVGALILAGRLCSSGIKQSRTCCR